MKNKCPDDLKFKLIQKALNKYGPINPVDKAEYLVDDESFSFHKSNGWMFWFNDIDGDTHLTKEKDIGKEN